MVDGGSSWVGPSVVWCDTPVVIPNQRCNFLSMSCALHSFRFATKTPALKLTVFCFRPAFLTAGWLKLKNAPNLLRSRLYRYVQINRRR